MPEPYLKPKEYYSTWSEGMSFWRQKARHGLDKNFQDIPHPSYHLEAWYFLTRHFWQDQALIDRMYRDGVVGITQTNKQKVYGTWLFKRPGILRKIINIMKDYVEKMLKAKEENIFIIRYDSRRGLSVLVLTDDPQKLSLALIGRKEIIPTYIKPYLHNHDSRFEDGIFIGFLSLVHQQCKSSGLTAFTDALRYSADDGNIKLEPDKINNNEISKILYSCDM